MIREKRFYSGKYFQPKPHFEFIQNLDLLMVTINWSDPGAEAGVVESIKESLLNVSESTEITRVGKFVEPIQEENPQLFTAFKAANDQFQKKYNSQEYTAAMELLLIKKNNSNVFWIKVGGPSILVVKQNQVVCVEQGYSLSMQNDQKIPIIPAGIGIDDFPPISQGSFRLAERESIVLLGRNYVPYQVFEQKSLDLNAWALEIAQEDPDQPFWLAAI